MGLYAELLAQSGVVQQFANPVRCHCRLVQWEKPARLPVPHGISVANDIGGHNGNAFGHGVE